MNHSFNENPEGNRLLEQIREGMKVYDQEDKQIGRVDTVYFGAVSEEQDASGTGAATPSTAGTTGDEPGPLNFAFGGVLDEDILGDGDEAGVLKNRLLREGYVKVDTSGIFSGDVYILPDQIASVSDGNLYLKVMRDSLIKR